jgi:hypothetical protein
MSDSWTLFFDCYAIKHFLLLEHCRRWSGWAAAAHPLEVQGYRMLNIGIAVKGSISERSATTSLFTRRMGWITHC